MFCIIFKIIFGYFTDFTPHPNTPPPWKTQPKQINKQQQQQKTTVLWLVWTTTMQLHMNTELPMSAETPHVLSLSENHLCTDENETVCSYFSLLK